MTSRAWRWAIVAASVVLIALGIHLAWEWHRYRLETPKGAISLGMTKTEVEAVLGPAKVGAGQVGGFPNYYELGGKAVLVGYGVNDAAVLVVGLDLSTREFVRIPRPSIISQARTWLTGKREEEE
jgi:hypothetical protein